MKDARTRRVASLLLAVALCTAAVLGWAQIALAETPDASNNQPGGPIPASPFDGTLGMSDPSDFWTINLNDGDTLQVTVHYNSPDDDVDPVLYSPSGSLLAWDGSIVSPDSITYTVQVGEAGIYNVGVVFFWAQAGTAPYTLDYQIGETVEDDCFTEQTVSIPMNLAFTVGHKLKVSTNTSNINLGAKLLPGDTGSGSFTFRVWSNDEAECRIENSLFACDDKGVNDEIADTASYPDGVTASDWNGSPKYDTDENASTIGADRLSVALNGTGITKGDWYEIASGPTGNAGVTCNVGLTLGAITYADHAGYYTGLLTLDVRQF